MSDKPTQLEASEEVLSFEDGKRLVQIETLRAVIIELEKNQPNMLLVEVYAGFAMRALNKIIDNKDPDQMELFNQIKAVAERKSS